ncbi:MAG: 4-(cytidine 5'-diphospho)-2-C-methyl-D-erythritol kinase [Chitinophagales bacterium]|nr:4-(cytidine 5'-diphospho)-2-C-methyl-D-erythritol kinase [Chitinophagaceae bacterium]MCB9063877.1 4-(cytidine 5'-diphospho)-2-C-methyl-D-erythritol kinase [Chitinophagales bacterium]
MICFPNCKINIGLYITNKRADGYHDLETIFYPIKGLHDALEVTPASKYTTLLSLHGTDIAGEKEQNLVWKAYNLLKEQFPAKIPELDINLLKAIPMGAGMGGGSADGAFMLKLLNDYCRLELKDDMLADMALQLGSDCPFFIYNTPQFATGRGEEMQPIGIDLSAYSIQLICPKVHISTGDAFKMLTPRKALFDLRTLPELPISQWKDQISNDFEDPIFMQHPQLADIKKQLYDQGAIYSAMSGSGSTVYGIFEKGEAAKIQSPLQYEQFGFDLT